jgi:hypothetical protein
MCAPPTIAFLTSAGLAVGSIPNRVVATPAAVGDA